MSALLADDPYLTLDLTKLSTGQQLRVFMALADVGTLQFAEAAGMPDTQISRYANDRNEPTKRNTARLREAIDRFPAKGIVHTGGLWPQPDDR